MIKHLLLGATAVVATSAMGQNFEATVDRAIHLTNMNTERVADTNFTYLNRASGLFSYSAPDGGNAVGNGYLTIVTSHKALDGIGAHYDGATGDLTEILFVAAQADVIGTSDQVTVAWYNVGTDSVPTTMVQSSTIDVSSFDLLGGFTTSGALTPAAVGGNPYAVVVEWASTIDDSVGIVASADGDGLGEERILINLSQQTSAETGGALAAGWQKNSVYGGFDLDPMIFPVLDAPVGTNEINSQGLHVERAFPNPATDFTTINYSLDKADNVNVKVFNLAGQTVYTESSMQSEGQHTINLNTADLAPGNYYYNIKTSKSNLTMKFIVQ